MKVVGYTIIGIFLVLDLVIVLPMFLAVELFYSWVNRSKLPKSLKDN